MVQQKTIEWSIDERGAVYCVLNRPERHNAFNEVMIEELTAFFLEQRESIRCRLVLLRGQGASFCAGADLHWMKKMVTATKEENLQDAKKLATLFQTINEFPKPLISAIHGSVMGGGVGLASVCDYVVAQENSSWGLTEVKLGLIPAVISPYVVAKIGLAGARAHFLSGSQFNGKRAYDLGLVHEIVSNSDELNERCQSLVSDFLLAGPHAQKVAKQLIFKVHKQLMQNNSEELIHYTCEEIAKLRVSSEGQEGMTALLNKRKPEWSRGACDD